MPDSLKSRIANGERLLGTVINSPGDSLIDAAAYSGYDYVLLDAEHGPFDIGTIDRMLYHATACGIPAVVRVETNDQVFIQRVLDSGADGIQVPQVNSPAEVERAVRAAHFAPRGQRGLATARAAHFGIDKSLQRHVEDARTRTVVIPQIEDSSALDHLDDLLSAEGPDLFFVGQSDLSQSLGHPGDAGHEDVQRAVDAIVRAAKRRGTPLATAASSPERIRHAFEQGFQVVTIVALTLFGQVSRQLREEMRTW